MNKETIDADMKAMLRLSREENFEARIDESSFQSESDDFNLEVTHNGYQSSSIKLNPAEARKVIEVLKQFL